MQSTQQATMPANQVMALFSDRALSFSLSPNATFGELADRLDHLDKRHTGLPTAIYLKFAMARKPVPTFQPET
jgi:hypothetical protein